MLLLLSTLALALLSMGGVEPLISRNLADAEQARFAAEAGIEWAFATLRNASDWDRFLLGADADQGTVLIAEAPIPGRPASRGTFTVRVRNDSQPGDPLVTGVPVDGGGPAHDVNGRLILAATGRMGSARRAVQAVLGRIELPPTPAALAFPSPTAKVSVGESFEIDGNDRNADDSSGSCEPVFGVSVSSLLPETAPGANEAVIEASLAAGLANVRGRRQDPTGPAAGANTIAADSALTPTRVQSFVAAARNADVVLASGEAGGVFVSDVGGSCASSWPSPTCWGTPEKPKVVHLKGDASPGAPVSALQISGSSAGHGILIVEDAELWVSGNFRWHGLIIITGRRVALGFLGGGDQAVYGATVFNDASSNAEPRKGTLIGNARLRYSCQALHRARQAQKLVTLRSWREGGRAD